MVYYVIALLVFVLDQGTKWIIKNKLDIGDLHPILGEFLGITSHRNKGAAFGILQNQRWFFVIITIAVVIAIIWYLDKQRKAGRKLLPFALSLVLGGAVGNFLDRALHGEVVDFVQVHFLFTLFGKHIDYIYPIFNVADSAIVVGVALIFVDALRGWWLEKKEQASHEHAGS